MKDQMVEVLTIGHSTLSYDQFLDLVRRASVSAIADVRTAPFSRRFPHFNRSTLREKLSKDSIAYVFLGEELGGRPKEKQFFRNGVADYEKMALTNRFSEGLNRVIDGAKKYRIAMMCSEHDPLDCHRCLLVGRALHERGVVVRHILSKGQIINHVEIEKTLMRLSHKDDYDLFEPLSARLAMAYRDRGAKVAFVESRTDADTLEMIERAP